MVAAPEASRETAKRAAEGNVEERVDGETEKVKKPRMEELSAKSEEEEQDDDAKEQADDGANDATAEKGGDDDELATRDYLDLTDAYGKEYRVKRIRSVDEVGQDKFEVKDANAAKIPKLSFFGAGDADDDRLDHFYTHPSLPLIMRIASLEERLMQGENEEFEDIKNEFEVYRYLQEEKKGKGEGEVYPVCVGWFQAPSNVGGWVVTLWKNTGKGAWGLLAELRSLNPLGVLKRLHKLGVVHGKLSPSNILISKDIVRPLFCDFKRATILNKVSEKEAEDLKKKDEDDLKRMLEA